MNILICGGDATNTFAQALSNSGLILQTEPDISKALEAVTITHNVEMLLLFDGAFMRDDKLLDINSIFSAISNLAPINKRMQTLLITKSEKVYDLFTEVLFCKDLTRCELTPKLTPAIILDCINGTYKKVEEQLEKHEEVSIGSVVEPAPAPEPPIHVSEPDKPKPAPQQKPMPTPKPKKEKPVKKYKHQKISLASTLQHNQIVIVTGNPNEGTTSTCASIASSLACAGIDTVLVDLDFRFKGLTMYFPQIDGGVTQVQKTGVLSAIKDATTLCDTLISVQSNLDYLGLGSSTEYKYIKDTLKMDSEITDLMNILAQDYRVTLIHISFKDLKNLPFLIRSAEHIVYCSACTINGINHTDFNLNTQHLDSTQQTSNFKVLHRKLAYYLTNYIENSITPDIWLENLLDFSKEPTLHQRVLGVLPHLDNFDDFENCKKLPQQINKNLQPQLDKALACLFS